MRDRQLHSHSISVEFQYADSLDISLAQPNKFSHAQKEMNKNLKIFFVSLAFNVLPIASFSALAQSQSRNVGDCQQGTCWDTYILEKRIIRQYQLGRDKRTIYLVDLKTTLDRKTRQEKIWVQCSIGEPFVASIPSFDASSPGDLVHINYINPGEKFMSNGERGFHKIYWAVCHNIYRPHPYEMGGIAAPLGYSLRLRPDTRVVPRSTFKP
jgi:hypothetical protein